MNLPMMTPLSRRSGNLILTVLALDLAFLAGTMLLWARSYLLTDVWGFVQVNESSSPQFAAGVSSLHGGVAAEFFRAVGSDGARVPWAALRISSLAAVEHASGPSYKGIELTPRTVGDFQRVASLVRAPTAVLLVSRGRFLRGGGIYLPHADMIAVIFQFAIGAWCARALNHKRSLRRRLDTCTVCGYDLRATLKRCPECGATARQRQSGNDAGTHSVDMPEKSPFPWSPRQIKTPTA